MGGTRGGRKGVEERRRTDDGRVLLGKEWTSETVEGGQERAGEGTAAGREEKRTSRSNQRGGTEERTRMGGQRGSGRGESGTERNK